MLTAFAAGVLSLVAGAVEVDGIAAKVGAETILKSEVYREMQRMRAPESAYNEIRNELIDRKLILKAAAEAKMTMQDWVIENRLRDIIDKAFEGDRNKLMETLGQQKVSYPEWRQRMKDDMIVAAMRWNVVDKYVVARPSDLRKAYAEHPERNVTGGKVTVSVILLKPEDANLRDEVSEALATTDFAELARKYSADIRAAEGGVWKDVVPSEVFKPEICEEIAKMPKATLSRWIELDGWSFLLRKDAEEAGVKLSFEEAYDQIEQEVKEAEGKAEYEAWMKRLRSETYIKVF